jgi:hypothetical protein
MKYALGIPRDQSCAYGGPITQHEIKHMALCLTAIYYCRSEQYITIIFMILLLFLSDCYTAVIQKTTIRITLPVSMNS